MGNEPPQLVLRIHFPLATIYSICIPGFPTFDHFRVPQLPWGIGPLNSSIVRIMLFLSWFPFPLKLGMVNLRGSIVSLEP